MPNYIFLAIAQSNGTDKTDKTGSLLYRLQGRGLAAAAAAAVTAVAVLLAAVTAAAILAATSAAVLVARLQFLGGGVAHELHSADKAHGLSRPGVVEVHGYLVVGHLDDLTVETHTLLGHHGHDGARTDVLGVKLALHVEDFLLEFTDEFGILLAEGLLGSQREVEFVALFEAHDVILEFLEQRNIESKHEGVGALLVELEHAGLLLAIHNKDFIDELHIFSCFDFHIGY